MAATYKGKEAATWGAQYIENSRSHREVEENLKG